jgi:hypothetical protein
MPIIETPLAEMLTDYDWREVFASAGIEDNAGNTGGTPQPAPGYAGSVESFSRADVAEVIASVNGENDERAWVCVVRLRDGRFAALEGSCDYTGWDCRASASCMVSDTLDSVVRFGVSKPECDRLGLTVEEEPANA